MRELGWIEKSNIEYLERYVQGDVGRCAPLAAELLAQKLDIIKTSNSDVAREASKAVGVAAGYVDRILKGAKPADLPVQQPMIF